VVREALVWRTLAGTLAHQHNDGASSPRAGQVGSVKLTSTRSSCAMLASGKCLYPEPVTGE
jgi:hypothetical protein